jgi:hypothetical protein
MRGANAVRDRLAWLLAEETPRKLPLLREAWRLDSVALPEPVKYYSGDAAEELVTDTSIIVVNPRLIKRARTGDISPLGEPEYHSRFSCRVYVWVKGPDWNRATEGRDNLAACMSLCMLQYPNLNNKIDPDALSTDTGYRVEEDTYQEDFGVPVRANGSRAFAAAILSVDITVEEYIDDGSTIPAYGTVNQLAAAAFAVGPLVPFPGEESP